MKVLILCCIGKGKRGRTPVAEDTVVVDDDDNDDDDDAIIAEFLPSLNETMINAALSSALSDPVSDDECETEILPETELSDTSPQRQLTLSPSDNQFSHHSDDGMLAYSVALCIYCLLKL